MSDPSPSKERMQKQWAIQQRLMVYWIATYTLKHCLCRDGGESSPLDSGTVNRVPQVLPCPCTHVTRHLRPDEGQAPIEPSANAPLSMHDVKHMLTVNWRLPGLQTKPVHAPFPLPQRSPDPAHARNTKRENKLHAAQALDT